MLPVSKFAFLPEKINMDLGSQGTCQSGLIPKPNTNSYDRAFHGTILRLCMAQPRHLSNALVNVSDRKRGARRTIMAGVLWPLFSQLLWDHTVARFSLLLNGWLRTVFFTVPNYFNSGFGSKFFLVTSLVCKAISQPLPKSEKGIITWNFFATGTKKICTQAATFSWKKIWQRKETKGNKTPAYNCYILRKFSDCFQTERKSACNMYPYVSKFGEPLQKGRKISLC